MPVTFVQFWPEVPWRHTHSQSLPVKPSFWQGSEDRLQLSSHVSEISQVAYYFIAHLSNINRTRSFLPFCFFFFFTCFGLSLCIIYLALECSTGYCMPVLIIGLEKSVYEYLYLIPVYVRNQIYPDVVNKKYNLNLSLVDIVRCVHTDSKSFAVIVYTDLW